MNTENLSNDRKEKSIRYIVQQGVVSPEISFKKLMDRMKICNIRTAFYGINDCIFGGIIFSTVFWLLFLNVDVKRIGCGVYLLSPLIYLVLYSFVVWKEMVCGLYEMKMVCRYDLQLLSSFRMLYFSIIGLVQNSIAIVMLRSAKGKGMEFTNLLGISFSSMFIYGIAILFCRWRWKRVISQLVCSGIWLAVNVLFICCRGRFFEEFLMNLPGYMIAAITCASSIVYFGMLYLNMSKRIEGEREYAFD